MGETSKHLIKITLISVRHDTRFAYYKVGVRCSSQTNSFLKCGIINLMSGLGVLGFWAWDDFWGRIITDSFKAT